VDQQTAYLKVCASSFQKFVSVVRAWKKTKTIGVDPALKPKHVSHDASLVTGMKFPRSGPNHAPNAKRYSESQIILAVAFS
jgi:hypothetical protein